MKNIFSFKKQNNAVVFAINDGYAFALANVILCIEKYDKGLVDQYVVFYSNITDENKNALQKIVKNIEFIKYDESDFTKKCPNIPLDAPFIAHWSHLPVAHFEMFDLLKRFHKVLWLDADMHIRGSIKKIFECKGLAWRASAADFHSFAKNYMSIPQEFTMPNCGLVYATDQIENYESLTQACYDIIADGFGKIQENKGHDEIVLGILNYTHNLKCELLPMIYNCPIGGKQTNKAIIIHFMGEYKVWKNPILSNMFYDLNENVQLFIEAGGKGYEGDKLLASGFFADNFGLLASFHTIKYMIMWKKICGDLYLNLPYNIIQTDNLCRHYIQYYIKGFSTKIHYELINEKDVKKYVCFHIEDKNIISNNDIIKGIREIASFINYELIHDDKTLGFRKLVSDKFVKNELLLMMELVHKKVCRILTQFTN